MGPQPDPYRTLGLQRGASDAEVKAAYRRLVKAFHPDAAGERAISRFLAIQAAYDAITGHERTTPRDAPTREPWRADPERARATRAGPGSRSGSARESSGAGRQRAGGQAADGKRSRAGQGAEGKGPRSGRSRRDATSGRATPGSTTYDAADFEPFNPEWSGASWYGTTSGTYWTINPKEYADPRKHGPEYQARARRAWSVAGGSNAGGEPEVGETTAETREVPDSDPGVHATGESPSATSAEATTSTGAEPLHRADEPRHRAGEGPHFRPISAEDRSSSTPPGGSDGRLDVFATLRLPPGLPSRAAIALLGWPPLGFAFATLVSEASGCGRFAASCVDTFDLGTWVGQLAIIGLLLAIPRLASISAIGTLVMLAAAGPAAVLLSATGGAREREAAATLLAVLLVVAYLVGVIFAVARTARTMRA
jgi:curved DNA-binding protein CbpA